MPCFFSTGISAPSFIIAAAIQYVDTHKPVFTREVFISILVTSVRTIPALKPDGYELQFVSRTILPDVNESGTYHPTDKVCQ